MCMESVIYFMEICPFHDAHRAIFFGVKDQNVNLMGKDVKSETHSWEPDYLLSC